MKQHENWKSHTVTLDEDEQILDADVSELDQLYLRTTKNIRRISIIHPGLRQIRFREEEIELEGFSRYYCRSELGVVRQTNSNQVFFNGLNITEFVPTTYSLIDCITDINDQFSSLWLCNSMGEIYKLTSRNNDLELVVHSSTLKLRLHNVLGLSFAPTIENGLALCRTTDYLIVINATSFQIQTVFSFNEAEHNFYRLCITYAVVENDIRGVFNHNELICILTKDCQFYESFPLPEGIESEQNCITDITFYHRNSVLLFFVSLEVILVNVQTQETYLYAALENEVIDHCIIVITRDLIIAVGPRYIRYIPLIE